MKQFLVGSLLFLIVGTSLFLLINSLEYQLWMGTTARFIVFFLSLLIITSLFIWLVGVPVGRLFKLQKGLSDEEAANEISKSFPEIEDKLLNTLQLAKLSGSDNLLLTAAIDKKVLDFRNISFIHAVDFSLGKKYGVILGSILMCLVLVSFINPAIIRDSTNRIVNFSQEFTPDAPFSFQVNDELKSFKGEDFTLLVEIAGSSLPEKVNLISTAGQKLRLEKTSKASFQYVFQKIQKSIRFQLEGAGFYSSSLEIIVNERPDLIAMNIQVKNPEYTGGERKLINNSGSLTVLEGSSVKWEISALSTDSLRFTLNGKKAEYSRVLENAFQVDQRIFESLAYQIELYNQFGKNSSEISYSIAVIKDEKPTINVEYFPDSIGYRYVTIAGNIIDDHGFSDLRLNYKKEGGSLKNIPLELSPNVKKQSFYANWNVDSLSLQPGERLEFFVSVSDNDGINGAKTSRSRTFIMEIPDQKEIEKIIDKKSEVVENQVGKSKVEIENINERLEEIEQKLKAEQKFDWQERKQLNDIVGDRDKLKEQIQELQKQHKELQKANEQFSKRSEQIKQRNEKLQTLLDQLLDEETKELYEQLKELLRNKNASSEQVRQQIQNLQKNEKNLERELDRALELFKRLKMESALEQNLQKLDTLSQRQKDLTDQQNIQAKQKDIQEEFEEFREKMDEVEELNQNLKRPEALQDFELEERQIAKELREIQEQLEIQKPSDQGSEKKQDAQNEQNGNRENQRHKNRQQIQKKQENASQKMKQLSQQLSNMQSVMQMEIMQANLDQLRDILDNLVKLSFNQEKLMIEFRSVNQTNPRFLELSQAQLKLKDDAKVIKDSLLALAKRVVQISSFITREVSSIDENIDGALDYLKGRNKGKALSSQQFAMTSINNLALLLDDTMQQMQMTMSEAMGNPSQGQKQQKGMPDLQKMQQQLGERINKLNGSGKQGRELSEELAKLAAEQELIRMQLEQVKQAEDGKPGGGNGGDNLQRTIDQMEQNETDLVNKKITQQLINRQQSIMTKMLEAEKAQREQKTEEEREAESPSVFSREIPPQFEEYLKTKQKEIELLKTIPLGLNPFYKKEVSDYFRRISSNEDND